MTVIDTRTATLGGRLRAARLIAGIEQADLAAELGYSRPSLSAWETGNAEIKASAMIRWAQITGVSLDWIAYGSGVRPEGFEPPAYCSVADDIGWPTRCTCGHAWMDHEAETGGCLADGCTCWEFVEPSDVLDLVLAA